MLYLLIASAEEASTYAGIGGVDLLLNGLKLVRLAATARFILFRAAYCRLANED